MTLPLNERHLPHQAGTDADLRQHFRRVKQFPLRLGPRFLPRQLHRAVRRQVAHEIGAVALRPRRAGKLKLRVRREPLQHDRLQHARRDTKIHRAPGIADGDGGIEMHLDGKSATAVETGDIAPLLDIHLPARFRAEAGQRDRAGEQLQRAAVRVLDLRVRREGERRDVAADIPGQLEIRQRDAARRRLRSGQRQQGAKEEQGKGCEFSFHSSIDLCSRRHRRLSGPGQ